MVTATARHNERESGFTLIEVLVGFSILAMSLGMAMDLFGAGLRTVGSASAHAKALSIADSLLSEVGSSIPLSAGETTGHQDGYRWTIQTSPLETWPPVRGLTPHTLVATVTWGNDRNEVVIETVRLAITQ